MIHCHGESTADACDRWERDAMQFARNAAYYRDLVVQCGNLLGKEAYIADDGTVMENVLCAKVPELVAKLVKTVNR